MNHPKFDELSQNRCQGQVLNLNMDFIWSVLRLAGSPAGSCMFGLQQNEKHCLRCWEHRLEYLSEDPCAWLPGRAVAQHAQGGSGGAKEKKGGVGGLSAPTENLGLVASTYIG